MAAGPDTLLRYIRRLVIAPEPDAVTDAALLGRFISDQDERAFAALVDRHGPLVLNVCRGVLGDADDAEDAFQATFLVLARKAARVHRREALAGWLHGVARRVALKARSARRKRGLSLSPQKDGPLFRPATPPADPRPDPLAELSGRELLMIIDSELERLPEVYRLPVILCCLEGRSLEEAARQLGWTPGSVKGRLERGRARLHAQLVRRGLTLSAALAAAEVSRGAVSAALLARLLTPTARGAMSFGARQTAVAAGVSAGAAALAGETLRSMALARLKIVATLLLATCILAAGVLTYRVASSSATSVPQDESRRFPSQDEVALVAQAGLANNRPGVLPDEDDAPIEVRGRVLDPAGNPFAGAKLYVSYSVRRPAPDGPVRQTAYPVRTKSGADGRFHFTFARSELDETFLDDSRPAVVAVADGYGADWAAVRESDEGAELSLQLVQDLPLNGRILNQDRQPVAGARIYLRKVESSSAEDLTRFLRGEAGNWAGKACRGPLPGQPASVMTAGDGRFQLTGIGRDRMVSIAVDGPGIEHTAVFAVTRPTAAQPDGTLFHLATFDHVAPASRPIRGVVRDQVTGRPVAGVKMSAIQANSPTLTDEHGRFEILGCPKSQEYVVKAQPQAAQPYFAAWARLRGGSGLGPVTADLELVSGIPLWGQVIVQTGRKLPRTAVVEYYPLFFNAHSSEITNSFSMPASSARIQPDGSYRLVVWPGPGVVCLAASPRDSYAAAMIDDKELANLLSDEMNHGRGQPLPTIEEVRGRGLPYVQQYNAMSLVNPDERTELLALDLTLQPAHPLRGTVVGPDGQPLTGVRVIGLTAIPDDEILESASFTVMGLNPHRSRDLFFHHRERNLGKALSIRGDETRLLTVQLEPCGWVTGRIVDWNGNPVPRVTLRFQPGEDEATAAGDGRFRVVLVPGQKYSLRASGLHSLLPVSCEVEVESGQSKDLGDLLLAGPSRGGHRAPGAGRPRSASDRGR